MSKKIEMLGKVFGRWTVIEEDGRGIKGEIIWKCQCSCGTIRLVCGVSLRRGGTRSCGCLTVDTTIARCKTHGLSKSLTYVSWSCMIHRCIDLNHIAHSSYRDRGIDVCERWLRFENFLEDMGERPKGLTIERINNDLGYFKENCKWATMTEQNRNQRLYSTNKTGVSGVSWHKKRNKYRAEITVKRKQCHIGMFDTIEEAAAARAAAELKYWHKETSPLRPKE